MNKRILFIDDDPNLLSGIRRKLYQTDYEVVTAINGQDGLNAIHNEPTFAVTVCDMRMPGMDGIEVLEQIQKLSPDTCRIMLTGNADQQTAIDAVNKGQIFRFLNKPCPDDVLIMALEMGIRQHQLVTAEHELLQQTLAGSVKVLTDVMALVMPEAFKSVSVVREWLHQLAPKLEVKNLWAVEIAGLISQIGFVAIPEDLQKRSLLNKRMTASEREILARAPQTASKLIRNLPRMGDVASILQYQWKGYDGSGVPVDRTIGDVIPKGARILRILSDLAAVTKGFVPDQQGIAHLMAHKEVYDPKLLQIIITHFADKEGKKATLMPGQAVECLSLDIASLRPGDLLIADICRKDGSLLLAGGTPLSEIQIEKLRNINRMTSLVEPVEVERLVEGIT